MHKLPPALPGLFLSFCLAVNLYAQGSLTPPGGPGPTMRTLLQVEPRTPIAQPASAAGFPILISAPGSYYLTGNITGVSGKAGIQIAANNVTIDLNGFSLLGLSDSDNAINLPVGPGYLNTVVKNGTISGWNFGVYLYSGTSARVENVHCANNRSSGIVTSDNGFVAHCTLDSNGESASADAIHVGERSGVTDCVLQENYAGIFAGTASSVTRCSVTRQFPSFDNGMGISTFDSSVIKECAVYRASNAGISAGAGSLVEASVADECGGGGISTGDNSTVKQCIARGNSFSGISVGKGASIIGCVSSENSSNFGISAGTGCLIIDCAARNNTAFTALSSGITAGAGSQIVNCNANSNTSTASFSATTGMGIYADKSLIVDCTATGNRGDGIRVETQSTIRGCNSSQNGMSGLDGAGVHGQGDANRIEGNNVVANARGIDIVGTGNIVFGNTAKGNSSNYEIAAGNRVGLIVIPTTSGAITGNGPGAGMGTTDPWANFGY